MDKVKITKATEIKDIVNNLQLKNITIETGNNNVYIPEENKVIVTQDFLSESTALFRRCETLEKIDMSNFDFSEITTMEWWFSYCVNLEEIIFPSIVYCDKLTNMLGTFRNTNIKHFNFTNWWFEKSLILNLTFSGSNCTTVKLGKMNVNSALYTFGFCNKLYEVDLGKFNFHNNTIDSDLNSFFGCLFKDCFELNLIDARNFTVAERVVDVSKVFSLHHVLLNCNEKCTVII